MNQSSNRRHKQRLSDQTLDSQDSKGDSKEGSGESSEDDEDDEDENHSTTTDESEESAEKNREWEALAKYLRSQRAYIERNTPDSFHRIPGAKKETRDKMTQKNLTSPMPSIWKPPVYKEVSAAPNFKVIKSKEMKEKESESEDMMLRYITKLQPTNNNYRNEYKKPCPHKPSTSEKIKKLCSKHIKQAEYKPKRGRREDVHTCVDSGVPSFVGYLPQPEVAKNRVSKRGMNTHPTGGLPVRYYRECSERESQYDETGKLKEKFLCMVEGEEEEEEEEEKGAAKMETDLISVNEILAIKQDLLELSEFAKKLKKLKELKSESENKKNFEAECQCKPLTELLKDVNKRMEALEARQEELERGIQNSRETEKDIKKKDVTNASSILPPLGSTKPKPSAVKSVSSFKSELSREEGGAFLKNLEIVNELLDIKSQLQKLERKRLSKELSPEIGPAGSSKNAKQKDQAINVFSSKTYILTSEQYKKKKNNKETDLEEKGSISMPAVKEKTAACTEGQKENDFVADWIKNISTPENQNSHLKVFASPNCLVKNEDKREESWQTGSFFKKDRDRNLEAAECGKQEPQKNRAKDTGRFEESQVSPKHCREIPSYLNRKEDRPALEELSWKNRLTGRTSKDTAGSKYFSKISPPDLKRSFAEPPKIVSSTSIPSVLAVKKELQRLNCAKKILKPTVIVKPSRSKSAQEFTSTSYLSKDEKMVLNMSRKNLEAKYAQKREKENENEQVQGEASKLPKINKEIHLDRSELLAAVNLNDSTSLRYDRSRSPEFPLPVFPFPILPPEMYKVLECCEKGTKGYRVDKENLCRRESSNHRPRKYYQEKKPIKDCIKKCYKKKTRVKCSRNHCCNKKARRAASHSSLSQKDLTPSCTSIESKRKAKICRCKRCRQFKTEKASSNDSFPCSERKKERKCKRKEHHYRRVEKCRKCCPSVHKRSKHHRSCCEALKTEEKDYKCQKPEEASVSEASGECRKQQKENQKKSFFKSEYCKPTVRAATICDDPCYATSFWKSLRKLYPRFSALQFMSWLKLYCQEENKTKQNIQKKQKGVSTGCKPPKEKPKRHECLDHQYCKCYRMSTFRQKWPSVSLSSKISEDNITEAETRSSNTSMETDFMFPYRKSKHFYTYKATHDEEKVEEEKQKKEECASTKKKNMSEDEGEESRSKKCRCDRCGHVHRRKKKKKKKKKRKKEVSCNKSCCKNTEFDSEPETTISEKSGMKNTKKPKKSILSRLGEVRNLHVCEGKLKCPGAETIKTWKKWCRSDHGSSKLGKCNCESKLLALENRINNLEKQEGEKKKKKKKKKGDDKKHKDKHKSQENHGHAEKKKKKKNKSEKEEECKCCCSEEKEKKHKKKKKDNKCYLNEDYDTEIYNCDCLDKGYKTIKESSAPTVTMTMYSTSLQSESSSFRQNLQRKKKELLEKLSSLTSYWKNFRRRRKTSDEIDLFDDSSKSGAVPNTTSMQPSSDEPSVLRRKKRHKKEE